ncbi:conidial pigment biosynthesis protein [Pseudozyma hubeiensis SY62]|uniref:Conidial pigment biosynthesis protein n=1 Tax=Pseudozyma hubeiensis (strain SY62) TaxID=1305764 RepID=R9NX10_PSEHS|nr:conidial pigment biosynthesis protein [Pseudozyma hubeiensis SY62]GAC93173.1 conidial pigment biosynthesis protein [Pseudozyma hubeiensis SY62]
MKSFKALLGFDCLLLLASWAASASADADNSTDALITYGQSTMNDTSPYTYHNSISAWYNDLLKVSLQRKAWPIDSYADGDDFAPIFELLEATYPSQTVAELDDDQWAEPFNFKGKELLQIADDLNEKKQTQNATNYYMRAANVFRVAYFPWVHEQTSQSKAKLYAWKMDKRAFKHALNSMDAFDVSKSGASLGGDEILDIPLRVFKAKNAVGTQPVVVVITGLDHYHTYMLPQITALTSYNFTVVTVAMPGTADSPITGKDSLAEEEYWTSIVDWLTNNPELFDTSCISFWGISMGSYWAVRVSRVERYRVRRVVSQGTASHYAFTRTWLEAAERLSYPASLQLALAHAFGYVDAESFKEDVEQYSLLQQGILDQDATTLIAVNGEKDTTFPIDDQRILAEHGPGALLRWFPHMGHNGEPLSSPWLLDFWQQRNAC